MIFSTTSSKTKCMVKFFLFLFIIFSAFTSNSYLSANDDLTGSKKEDNQNDNSSEFVKSTTKYDNMFDDIVYTQNIENYEYFELLGTEYWQFENWLFENFDYNNALDYQFINDNYNKLILKAIKLNIIRNILDTNDMRFGSNTHSQITSDALTILMQDGKSSAFNFYNRYFSNLMSSSVQPDIDESYNGTHYYVFGSSQNDGYYKNNVVLDKDYSISARTRFEEHYYTAINAYKNGYITASMDELGRALHYLQDVACTPHSTGYTKSGDNSKHARYESWLNLVYPGNSIYHASTANEVYNTILNLDNPGIILNQIAEFSAAFEEELTHDSNTTDINYSYYVTIASACLPYS